MLFMNLYGRKIMGKKKNKKKKDRENINVKTKVYVIFTILLIALIGV